MDNKQIIKQESNLIQKVGNAISVTNKLLALIHEPQLIPYRKGDKWGYCTPDKKIVIDCIYERAHCFYNGIAVVLFEKKFQLISGNGNLVKKLDIDDTSGEFYGGFCTFKKNNKKGFFDINGEFQGKIQFDSVQDFYNEMSLVKLNGKYGFINQNGDIVIPFEYDDLHDFYHSDYSIASIGNKKGVIDKMNNRVLPFIYNNIIEITGNYIRLRDKDKWAFMNLSGQVITKYYDDIGIFSEDLASVKIKDKYGFINRLDELIIPNVYDYAGYFTDGLCPIMLDGKYYFIDHKGIITINEGYDKVSEFYRGICIVEKNKRKGVINKSGKILIPFKYDEIDNFSNSGIASVSTKSLYHCGYINLEGVQFWED